MSARNSSRSSSVTAVGAIWLNTGERSWWRASSRSSAVAASMSSRSARRTTTPAGESAVDSGVSWIGRRMLRAEREPEPGIDEPGVGRRHERVVAIAPSSDPFLGRDRVEIANELGLADRVACVFDPHVRAPDLVARAPRAGSRRAPRSAWPPRPIAAPCPRAIRSLRESRRSAAAPAQPPGGGCVAPRAARPRPRGAPRKMAESPAPASPQDDTVALCRKRSLAPSCSWTTARFATPSSSSSTGTTSPTGPSSRCPRSWRRATACPRTPCSASRTCSSSSSRTTSRRASPWPGTRARCTAPRSRRTTSPSAGRCRISYASSSRTSGRSSRRSATGTSSSRAGRRTT